MRAQMPHERLGRYGRARGAALKKQTPRGRPFGGRRGVSEKIPAATYSPTRKPCSTIGSGGLNFRVRDGNGWNPSDEATGKPVEGSPAYAQEACVATSGVTALDPGLPKEAKR